MALGKKLFTIAQLEHAMHNYYGYCTNCGALKECCEPDARDYECDECKSPDCYGAMELMTLDRVEGTPVISQHFINVCNDEIRATTHTQYRLNEAGQFVKDGKASGVIVRVKNSRIQITIEDTKELLSSGPLLPSTISHFLQSYWYCQPKTEETQKTESKTQNDLHLRISQSDMTELSHAFSKRGLSTIKLKIAEVLEENDSIRKIIPIGQDKRWYTKANLFKQYELSQGEYDAIMNKTYEI